MGRHSAPELSEFERKRQENIARNKILLGELVLTAAETGLAPKKRKRESTPSSASKKTKRSSPKPKEHVQPTRTSSRLRNIPADSEIARQRAEEERLAQQAVERAKKQRISDDVEFSALPISGPAEPGKRTFTDQDIKQTTDKGLRTLRERMSKMQLWEDVEPNRIKITPERVYAMGMHPTTDKALVFAGDKMGNLGIFDSSQSKDETESDASDDSISITSLKPHTRTVSGMQFSVVDPNVLYTSSYDSSLRKIDLVKGKAVEVYAPKDVSEDAPLSGVQMAIDHPNRLYFSTLDGAFGWHDDRTPSWDAKIFQLSEKKIGGFSVHPLCPHLVATASLDRTLKLWDLRKITKKLPTLIGEHESRLSVSHAAFNTAGQVATTSYDDTIKIYDFSVCTTWDKVQELKPEQMKPVTTIPHNNQTGRWVTILKAHWQQQPQDGIQRLCIGNMNRFVDIYTGKGDQIAQLGGPDITAVPAVAHFHPTMDWVAGGTASGKLCLWM